MAFKICWSVVKEKLAHSVRSGGIRWGSRGELKRKSVGNELYVQCILRGIDKTQ